eukprot:4332796-Pleurochrysis_carterae.AAC.2
MPFSWSDWLARVLLREVAASVPASLAELLRPISGAEAASSAQARSCTSGSALAQSLCANLSK